MFFKPFVCKEIFLKKDLNKVISPGVVTE